MDNLKLTMATMLKTVLMLCLCGFSLQTLAESDPADFGKQHEVMPQRNPDYKCIQCHKDAQETLRQSHGEGVIDVVGRNITCTDCHGDIGPEHRVTADKVTTYDSAQSQPSESKQHLSPSEILNANRYCTDCHQSQDLQEQHWTHDVHAQNLTCSNCHAVHGHQQGVLGTERKQLAEMCVDCHADFSHKE